jgi:hypothetical protein
MSTALAQNYRNLTLQLRAQTVRDFLKLWPAIDWRNLKGTYSAWLGAAALLVERDRQVSHLLATHYLSTARAAAGVPGQPPRIPLEPLARDAFEVSMATTALEQVLNGLRAGRPLAQASDVGFVTASGSASRYVLNAGRETIMKAAATDRRFERWERVTSSSACKFCRDLAGRGAVYRSEVTAEFHAHDACVCSADVVYA